jgi:hypothetical protein
MAPYGNVLKNAISSKLKYGYENATCDIKGNFILSFYE